MKLSDEAFVMLFVRRCFAEFTTKQGCDTTAHSEALLAFACESREEVDEVASGSQAWWPTGDGCRRPRVHGDPELLRP